MLRLIPAVLLVSICAGASAQTLYKCTDKDGAITYSGAKCTQGEMKEIAVPAAPPVNPNHAQELARDKATAAALEKARLKREGLEQKGETETNVASRAEACAAKRKEQKIAEENAERAPGFKKASMRDQNKKAAEALAAECSS
ncbi:MAG: DUF4124 domain-containing protein [Massilia sp.]